VRIATRPAPAAFPTKQSDSGEHRSTSNLSARFLAGRLWRPGLLWKDWGENGLVQFFIKGVAPNGKPAGPPMPQYALTGQDARATVEYLKSLP
jgi:hypothetical protein